MRSLMQFLLILILIPILFQHCADRSKRPTIHIDPVTGPVPYSNLDVNNSSENFQFAIVTDRTGGHRPGVFMDGIRKLNLLQPEFVMSVGDLIEGYTEDTVELDRQWREFNGFIDSLKAPFFYVPGNHDITNKVMEDKWRSLFGRTYYDFIYKNVLFMCLNSEDNHRGAGRGTVDDDQYNWIEKTLNENPDVRWTLVFMHQPLWSQEEETLRWKDVEALLAKRKHTVYVGHRHNYTRYVRNNGKYFVLATTGGSSRLRGTQVGEFDHVVWITMTEDGPVMANLLLEGIWDEGVVTEEMRGFFSPLLNKQPIRIAPLMVSAARFTSGSSEIRITNDSDAKMEVRLEVEANRWLMPGFFEKDVSVAPNAVEKINLKVTGNPDRVEDIRPIELRAHVRYMPEGLPDVSLEYEKNISPEKREYIPLLVVAHEVDGNLTDWGVLRFRNNPALVVSDPFFHKGSDDDGSFQFDIGYDNRYLYVAASITDDEILTSGDGKFSDQDAIHITLDARSEAVSAVSTGGDALHISQGPGDPASSAERILPSDGIPEGTRVVTVRTKRGYDTEVAIPLNYIIDIQGADWRSVRINVHLTDVDREHNHRSTLWYRPDWKGPGNYSGSGLFFRQP